jgi:hypothetical protein
MQSTLRLLATVALFTATLVLSAQTGEKYKAGDAFAAFTTKDQHEKEYTYPGGARLVIVSFEMGTGKAANSFFEKQPATFLDDQKAVFIANIYGMPGIGRMFALPKMKKYPHRILLADAENFLVRYPEQNDMLTVLSLDEKGTVTDVRFVNPKKDLAALFAAAK